MTRRIDDGLAPSRVTLDGVLLAQVLSVSVEHGEVTVALYPHSVDEKGETRSRKMFGEVHTYPILKGQA
jgi:hypothetical protein